jgi:hypothetical protein
LVIPGSPGNTNPVGDFGNIVDVWPGFQAWILPCVSYHGMLTSQRKPRFSVRFGVTFQVSCTNAPPYFVLESNTCLAAWTYAAPQGMQVAPSRKSPISDPVTEPSKVNCPFGLAKFRSLTCRYRNSPPAFHVCLPWVFENTSLTVYVVLGWKVLSVGTPRFKPMTVKVTCGRYVWYPGWGAMPSVLAPVTNPSEERSTLLAAVGLSLWSTLRNTVARASFTAVLPRVFVLLITNCCTRAGVTVGNPGTLAKPANALSTSDLSKW